ncbi:MAG: hypothetical protein AVDCRST_MAG09-1421, partial [uncultured Sphingomonas sp.]
APAAEPQGLPHSDRLPLRLRGSSKSEGGTSCLGQRLRPVRPEDRGAGH